MKDMAWHGMESEKNERREYDTEKAEIENYVKMMERTESGMKRR